MFVCVLSLKIYISFKIHFLKFHVCLWVCMPHVYKGAQGGQKASHPLELELQTVMGQLKRRLGPKLGLLARAARILNRGATFQPLLSFLKTGSHIPGWSQTWDRADDSLELLTILPPPPLKCWDVYVILGTDPRAWCVPGKRSTDRPTELYPQLNTCFLKI